MLPERFERYHTSDSLGRRISFFVSKETTAGDSRPLALYIQGSGCHSVFRRHADGGILGGYHNLLLDSSRGAVRVLVVEKPGVVYLDPGGQGGTAIGCRPRFLREHTLERWSQAILAAVVAARRLDHVSLSRMLVVGHSEGGIVAAKIAAQFDAVTHLALFGSSGPTQLFDLLENERDGECACAAPDADRCALIRHQLHAIHSKPDSPTRFAWGHPYRRWSSFLATSVLDESLRSSAKVRIVHGLSDTVVPASAAKLLFAELLRRGRDVVSDFHDSAGHNLATPGKNGPEAMLGAFDSTVKWFLE